MFQQKYFTAYHENSKVSLQQYRIKYLERHIRIRTEYNLSILSTLYINAAIFINYMDGYLETSVIFVHLSLIINLFR